jgi:hypothetical protein
MTRSPAPRRPPAPAEIALAYDALVEALWTIRDQSEAGGPNFAGQIARALGELAGRPDDSLPSISSQADTRPPAPTAGAASSPVDGGAGMRT